MTSLAYKLTQTSAVDDRRLRRDLQAWHFNIVHGTMSLTHDFQDTLGKLFESCVTTISRPTESGLWARRQKENLNSNGRESPDIQGSDVYLSAA